MPKFENKNGDLSAYSFLCGYVQREENDELYKDLFMEHRHFHVKAGKHGQKWSVWEVFERDELTKARALFNSIKLGEFKKDTLIDYSWNLEQRLKEIDCSKELKNVIIAYIGKHRKSNERGNLVYRANLSYIEDNITKETYIIDLFGFNS